VITLLVAGFASSFGAAEAIWCFFDYYTRQKQLADVVKQVATVAADWGVPFAAKVAEAHQ